MATNRIKPNQYKPEHAEKSGESAGHHSKHLFRIITWTFMMAMMSLGAIYIHDAIVQSPFFTVSRIEVKGNFRVSKEEILARAGLNRQVNIFELHLPAVEQKIARHPWVDQAYVKRQMFSSLEIIVEEEKPLAIVTIENLADVVINTQGKPFKEYDPETDHLEGLPVISGVDLTLSGTTYGFEGDLFNVIMDLLHVEGISQVKAIHGDENTGLTIKSLDIYNKRFYKEDDPENQAPEEVLIPIKLGFDKFEEKLARARKISRYVEENFPSKAILAMDLFDMEKIFIKTEDALRSTTEKGV